MKKKSSGEKKIRQRLIVKGIVYGVFVTILQALLTPIFYRVSDVIESIMKSRVLLPPLGITFYILAIIFGWFIWISPNIVCGGFLGYLYAEMIKKNKHRIFSLVIGFIAAYLKILIDYVLASVIEGSIINFEFYYYDFLHILISIVFFYIAGKKLDQYHKEVNMVL